MCGSGQQAIHFGAQAISSGDQDIVIACGVEMMGVVMMGSDSNPEIASLDYNKEVKLSFGSFPYKLLHQGVSAELIAEKYGIKRDDVDNFAMESHIKCFEAIKKGFFESQIVPIKVKDEKDEEKIFKIDEGVRYPIDKKN